MDKLQLIASIIDSLAWPIAAILLVFILRVPLRTLLGNLTQFRYGNVEINFGREIRELGNKAKAAGLYVPEDVPRTTQSIRNSAHIIADAMCLTSEFQTSAVILAWTAVEQELMQAVMRLAISPDYPPYNASLKNIQLLYEQEYLEADSYDLLDRMRDLRNAVANPSRGITEISADDAREFVVLTEAITDKLKSLDR